MKKILPFVALLLAMSVVSCKSTKDVVPVVLMNSTSNIVVPSGFTRQTSRTLNFTISLTDTRFQNLIQVIAVYDGDPAAGGNLLAKGSATVSAPFQTKLYIAYQIKQVYIVKTAPDNTKVTQKLSISTADVITSIGV